jgi:predicted metalloprotease
MVGEGLLERLIRHGWIERRSVGRHPEIKITPAGVAAMRAKIPNGSTPSLRIRTLAKKQIRTTGTGRNFGDWI